MNFLKACTTIGLLAGMMVFTSSCKDDCDAPAIGENIIGVWNPKLSGGEVEFKSDGTYVDEEGSLFSVGTPAATDVKTYTVTEEELTLTIDVSGNTSSITFPVVDNQCDDIKISALGIEETLERK